MEHAHGDSGLEDLVHANPVCRMQRTEIPVFKDSVARHSVIRNSLHEDFVLVLLWGFSAQRFSVSRHGESVHGDRCIQTLCFGVQ